MEKYIVITGATKGLGRAIAEIFAAKGFHLAVCARTQADLEDMAAHWKQHFPASRLMTCAADLGKKDDVLHFAAFVRKNCPVIDVLVNNAGLFIPGKITEQSEGTVETLMEINFFSAYHLTRQLIPVLLKQGRGHIFNMCSVASIVAYPNGGAYSISKFALLGFSKVLRQELKVEGIKVTAVLPGATWSDSWQGVDLPEERLMQANDIAKAVWGAYDLSDAAVVEELLIRPQLGDL